MGTFGRELCAVRETDRRKGSVRSDLRPDHWYKIQPNDPITEAVMEQSRFAQQNAERMIESANFGLTWTREFAEQTLNQSKAALDAFLKASNRIAKTFEGQSSAVREQTTVLTEKALSNSVDFGQKCLRAKEPDELVRLQTDFVAQQAQIFAEQTKELGQKIQNATQTAYDTLADAARKTEQSIARSDQSLKRHRSEA